VKKWAITGVLLSVIAASWALLPDKSLDTKTEKLVLTGSSTIAPLAAEIGKRFEALHGNVRVDVQTGGSSRGVSDARAGLADIGMASRALKEDEKDLLSFTIALDGISVIVNKANPVVTLNKRQIVDIYTGKIVNWKAVGGNDAPITVVNKAEGRSTLELFLHYFGLKNTEVKPHVVIGDNQQGIKTVVGNPDAIGYVSVGTAEYEAGQGAAIKLLPLDGIAASVENVRNRSFPLSRPLNLVTRAEPVGLAKAFIEFARLPQTNDLIEAQYFVPIPH
jgi:phosphate transport system substrate-binding protein